MSASVSCPWHFEATHGGPTFLEDIAELTFSLFSSRSRQHVDVEPA